MKKIPISVYLRPRLSSEKISTVGKIHFELDASAFERLKEGLDKVRAQIDRGMMGELNEWVALETARKCLFDFRQLLEKEVYIVQENKDEEKSSIGGVA